MSNYQKEKEGVLKNIQGLVDVAAQMSGEDKDGEKYTMIQGILEEAVEITWITAERVMTKDDSEVDYGDSTGSETTYSCYNTQTGEVTETGSEEDMLKNFFREGLSGESSGIKSEEYDELFLTPVAVKERVEEEREKMLKEFTSMIKGGNDPKSLADLLKS